MRSGNTLLILVITAAALALLVFAYFSLRKPQMPLTGTGPTTAPTVSFLAPSPASTTDTDIDMKLKELDSSSTVVDQSLKDQPVDVMAE